MGDFDYGYEKGLWGADGMPYGMNSRGWTDGSSTTDRNKGKQMSKTYRTKRYNSSEQRAYDHGFRAVYDDNAYNGRYFMRDDKIWIHDIDALKNSLDIWDEDELKELGYDVDTYYELS